MKRLVLATMVAALVTATESQAAVAFNFTFAPGTSANAQAAFTTAGALWSSALNDDVTVDLTVGTGSVASGALAQTTLRRQTYSYATYRTALGADAASAADAVALANLDPGADFDLLINRTLDNPNGAGSATPYLDTTGVNNSTIRMTTANAKALGLAVEDGAVAGCTSTCDASILISSGFSFDYDPSDGVLSGTYDFVTVAASQIGRALGFISGVEILDLNSPPQGGPFLANAFDYVSPLDLYRYSALSAAQGAIDWTADGRDKYFSIDGGATVGPGFSTGRFFGNGFNPGRWIGSIGLMDPTLASGETKPLTDADRLAFDVIGWDLRSATPPPAGVPEPGSWTMLIAGFALLGGALRRRRGTRLEVCP